MSFFSIQLEKYISYERIHEAKVKVIRASSKAVFEFLDSIREFIRGFNLRRVLFVLILSRVFA